MSTSKPIILLTVMISALLLLAACGGDDADTASAPAPATESAPAANGDSMGSPMVEEGMAIEKAEGVIYQDEIYANWPYN